MRRLMSATEGAHYLTITRIDMSRAMLRLRKGDEVKYLSHLDVMRAFEFALRRAQIPVSYSEGFNPRPRMSLGSAVGVGVTSDDERIIVELASPMDGREVGERLGSKLPAGFEVLDAEVIPDGVKSPLSALNASRFRIEFSCEKACDCSTIENALSEILDSTQVVVSRARKGETKDVDIRPHLLDARLMECSDDSAALEVRLRLGDSGGARPQDFAQALQNRIANTNLISIRRLEQFHAA